VTADPGREPGRGRRRRAEVTAGERVGLAASGPVVDAEGVAWAVSDAWTVGGSLSAASRRDQSRRPGSGPRSRFLDVVAKALNVEQLRVVAGDPAPRNVSSGTAATTSSPPSPASSGPAHARELRPGGVGADPSAWSPDACPGAKAVAVLSV
jgi:hypothetical protein